MEFFKIAEEAKFPLHIGENVFILYSKKEEVVIPKGVRVPVRTGLTVKLSAGVMVRTYGNILLWNRGVTVQGEIIVPAHGEAELVMLAHNIASGAASIYKKNPIGYLVVEGGDVRVVHHEYDAAHAKEVEQGKTDR